MSEDAIVNVCDPHCLTNIPVPPPLCQNQLDEIALSNDLEIQLRVLAYEHRKVSFFSLDRVVLPLALIYLNDDLAKCCFIKKITIFAQDPMQFFLELRKTSFSIDSAKTNFFKHFIGNWIGNAVGRQLELFAESSLVIV
jgi:hypothetical protein